MLDKESVLTLPALGQDVQLGMLYDARTSSFFSGASLWSYVDVNENQEMSPSQVQNVEYKLSFSLEEARKNAGLDVEASLSLDLGLLKATGSAKYLNDKKTSTFEAHVDVSCTVARRTRRIPQEKLANMPYASHLDNTRFTHYVAEVVEGGTATLSFSQACKSAEEMTKVQGELEVGIKSIPIRGEAKLDYQSEENSTSESLRVTYSGAIIESVATMDDARRVACGLPEKLAQQMNTLSFTLVPVSVLDSNCVGRHIRELDAVLVKRTINALKGGGAVQLELDGLYRSAVSRGTFPMVQEQQRGFKMAFERASTEFSHAARRLLPELRGGNTDYNAKIAELEQAVALFEHRTRVAGEFKTKKSDEAVVLVETIEGLFADGFEDHVSIRARYAALLDVTPRLMISFGGADISRVKHPLQNLIEPSDVSTSNDRGDGGSSSEDDDMEWFEDSRNVSYLIASCAKLRSLRGRLLEWGPSAPAVALGVASINRAHLPGKSRRVSTQMGDIVLDFGGKLTIVTSHIPGVLEADNSPFVPVISAITCTSMSVEIPWPLRGKTAEAVLPTTATVLRFCAKQNPERDGAFPRASESETPEDVIIDKNSNLDQKNLAGLKDDCDYEVQICFLTIVGPSEWSASTTARTIKPPSVASDIIKFYDANREELSSDGDGVFKRWEMSEQSNALYLGHKITSERQCQDERFQNEVALRIVDVAPQFRPEVAGSDVNDSENTKIVVFVGATGHGKSTQINALVAFLLGSELSERRLMTIDDRGANQALSVTKYITCYRIRPLSDRFGGKTLLIVDTPGYGDTGTKQVLGYERDQFVTSAMNVFFGAINHVNSVVFTCHANTVRTTVLQPVSTYVFQLFAKNVSSCLRTIYTFSDAGNPLAQGTLKQLEWPVENGEVEVNNAAFNVAYTEAKAAKLADWWNLSMNGQYIVLNNLMLMGPISTKASEQVATDRLSLERQCKIAEQKIMRTANDARNLIARLDALANAVGAAPNEMVEVKNIVVKQRDVVQGEATTLCTKCNLTCHERCFVSNDDMKIGCASMNDDGICINCQCHWTKHKNTEFILIPEEVIEMVTCQELIDAWNKYNNTLEGALLSAMDEYRVLQEELKNDILNLATLTEKLMKTALRHNPAALINYVETLIMTARDQGALPEHVAQLTTAKNMLKLTSEIEKIGSDQAMSGSNALLIVMQELRGELKTRMELNPKARAEAESKPCKLYNNLRERLPKQLQSKAPPKLKSEEGLYPDNLRAIVKLVQLVLSDGGVVGVLAVESPPAA